MGVGTGSCFMKRPPVGLPGSEAMVRDLQRGKRQEQALPFLVIIAYRPWLRAGQAGRWPFAKHCIAAQPGPALKPGLQSANRRFNREPVPALGAEWQDDPKTIVKEILSGAFALFAAFRQRVNRRLLRRPRLVKAITARPEANSKTSHGSGIIKAAMSSAASTRS